MAKYGAEKTPYLDIFRAVCASFKLHIFNIYATLTIFCVAFFQERVFLGHFNLFE